MALNIATVGIGAAVRGIGLYVSGKAIHDESGNAVGPAWIIPVVSEWECVNFIWENLRRLVLVVSKMLEIGREVKVML